MLRWMDRNRNGRIDPEEVVGRLGERIKSMAREKRIDLSRSVSIDQLSKALERRDDRRKSDSRELATEDDYGRALPLGFGTDEENQPLVDIDPTLGFGNDAETFAVKIVEADRRTVGERFRRYDSNRDGYLSREEIARNRWSDDPMKYDRNRDGRLSPAEMAVRYAQRRLREEERRRDEGKRREEERRRKESRESRGGDNSRTSRIVQFTFDRYDRNKNGRLDRDEWGSMRSNPAEADANKNGSITREEYTRWMEKRMSSSPWGSRSRWSSDSSRSDSSRRGFARRDSGRRDSGRRDSGRRDSGSSSEKRDSGGSFERRSYSYATPHDRLPRGIEQWFIDADADRDGQVAMSEFATSFDSAIIENFRKFDRNGDGLITPAECLAADEAGVSYRGGSGAPSRESSTSTSEHPKPAASAPVKIDPRYRAHYGKLFAKYDANQDGALVKSEWSEMKKSPEGADTDGNGRITQSEFITWAMRGQ